MATLPKKAFERIASGLKRFQPILSSAKARDVNESDTVVIVTDLLQDIFGYDKYSEITSEHMIRGTFCDLAVKLQGELALLIEVKAIGLDLKDQFVKQAVDYAANQGVEWVALTNGVIWRVYRIMFSKPIENELVVEFDLLNLNQRNSGHIQILGLLAKEGWQKAFLGDYASQKQALSRFNLAALMMSSPVLDVLRREVRRLSPEVKIDMEQLKTIIQAEVIKRDVLEGEKADLARKQINRIAGRTLRAAKTTSAGADSSTEEPEVPAKDMEPEISNQN